MDRLQAVGVRGVGPLAVRDRRNVSERVRTGRNGSERVGTCRNVLAVGVVSEASLVDHTEQ